MPPRPRVQPKRKEEGDRQQRWRKAHPDLKRFAFWLPQELITRFKARCDRSGWSYQEVAAELLTIWTNAADSKPGQRPPSATKPPSEAKQPSSPEQWAAALGQAKYEISYILGVKQSHPRLWEAIKAEVKKDILRWADRLEVLSKVSKPKEMEGNIAELIDVAKRSTGFATAVEWKGKLDALQYAVRYFQLIEEKEPEAWAALSKADHSNIHHFAIRLKEFEAIHTPAGVAANVASLRELANHANAAVLSFNSAFAAPNPTTPSSEEKPSASRSADDDADLGMDMDEPSNTVVASEVWVRGRRATLKSGEPGAARVTPGAISIDDSEREFLLASGHWRLMRGGRLVEPVSEPGATAALEAWRKKSVRSNRSRSPKKR